MFSTYNLQGGTVKSNSTLCIFSDKCLRGLKLHYEIWVIYFIYAFTLLTSHVLGSIAVHF